MARNARQITRPQALVGMLLTLASGASAQSRVGPYTFYPTNTSGVVIGRATIDGASATDVDIVAARDQDGNVAGAAAILVLEGTAYVRLPIYGDDVSTPSLDEGMDEGEAFSLEIFDASSGATVPLGDLPSSWSNANGGPMAGYDDPGHVFAFSTPPPPPINQNLQVSLSSGWAMVGMPLVAANMHFKGLFPDATDNTLFRYSRGYSAPDPPVLVPGEGFWLRFPSTTVATLSGIPVLQMEIRLRQGWNLISGPFCSVPSASIHDPDALIIPGTLFGLSGSYVQSNSLEPGRAYWIRSTGVGSIALSCSADKSLAPVEDPVLESFGLLRLQDASGSVSRLWFGGSLPAGATPFAYTLPPRAPNGIWTASFEAGRYVSTSLPDQIDIHEATLPITITSDSQALLSVLAADGRELIRHHLDPARKVIIDDPAAQALRIIGSDHPEPIRELTLDPARPNPLADRATLRFYLPKESRVQLQVFDALGRRVAVLLDDVDLSAGWHQVDFDGRDEASGVYFAVLQGPEAVARTALTIVRH